MAHAVGWAALLRLHMLLRVFQRQNLKNGRPLFKEVVQSLLLIPGKRMSLVQQHWLAVPSLCPRNQVHNASMPTGPVPFPVHGAGRASRQRWHVASMSEAIAQTSRTKLYCRMLSFAAIANWNT